MRTSLPIFLGAPPSAPEVSTLVEIDRRRGSIGLQYSTTPGQAVRTTGALWLQPDQAEALALALLGAVGEWRADAATAAWTAPAGAEVAR